MNSFIYLIRALDPCHLPTMSPPFPIFFRWQLSSNCTRLPLSVGLWPCFPLPLYVCLSLYVLVPNCNKFHVCKNTVFLCNEWGYYSWPMFCFCLGHLASTRVMYLTYTHLDYVLLLPGTQNLDWSYVFDHPLSLLWIFPLPPLRRTTLGMGSLKNLWGLIQISSL